MTKGIQVGSEVRMTCYSADYRVKITTLLAHGILGEYNAYSDFKKEGYAHKNGTFNFDSIEYLKVYKKKN
jgi:hypothetical protein